MGLLTILLFLVTGRVPSQTPPYDQAANTLSACGPAQNDEKTTVASGYAQRTLSYPHVKLHFGNFGQGWRFTSASVRGAMILDEAAVSKHMSCYAKVVAAERTQLAATPAPSSSPTSPDDGGGGGFVLFAIVVFLGVLAFIWAIPKKHENHSLGPSPRGNRRSNVLRISDEGYDRLARDLQRLAAECTDGSVKINEPERTARSPKITWTKVYEPAEMHYLIYRDARGNESSRYIRLTRKGQRADGIEVIEGYDGARLKTYREDRIISLEIPLDPDWRNRIDQRRS